MQMELFCLKYCFCRACCLASLYQWAVPEGFLPLGGREELELLKFSRVPVLKLPLYTEQVLDMSQVYVHMSYLRQRSNLMPKWCTRTPYKSKVYFRYLLLQVPRRSWYSQGARPRHQARPGDLDKTMTTSKTKSSCKNTINHGITLQPVTVRKRVIM